MNRAVTVTALMFAMYQLTGARIRRPRLQTTLLLMAAAIAAREMMRQPAVKLSEKGALACQEKYCNQVFIDRPLNTEMKDQSLNHGLGLARPVTIRQLYRKVKGDLAREQAEHPGVRRVAHTVV